jgi:PAS domain S-box-containing protein
LLAPVVALALVVVVAAVGTGIAIRAVQNSRTALTEQALPPLLAAQAMIGDVDGLASLATLLAEAENLLALDQRRERARTHLQGIDRSLRQLVTNSGSTPELAAVSRAVDDLRGDIARLAMRSGERISDEAELDGLAQALRSFAAVSGDAADNDVQQVLVAGAMLVLAQSPIQITVLQRRIDALLVNVISERQRTELGRLLSSSTGIALVKRRVLVHRNQTFALAREVTASAREASQLVQELVNNRQATLTQQIDADARLTRMLLLVLGLAAMAGLAVVWLVARTVHHDVVTPIRRVTAAIISWREGHPISLPRTNGGELDAMASAFEGLLSSLEARNAALAVSQDRLAEQTARLEAVQAISADAIVAMDGRGRITGFNHAAELLFRRKADEMRGKSFKDLVPPAHRASYQHRAAELMMGPDRSTLLGDWREFRAFRPDGSEVPVSVTAAKTTVDRRASLTLFIRDMTDAAQAESALREARDLAEAASLAKSEFLATVSHELRTPLNAILGFSEVLRSGIGGELSGEQNGYVGDISTAGTQLLRLIDRILQLAQLEAGSFRLDESIDDVALAVHAALERHRAAAGARTITLAERIDPPSIWLRCDPRALATMLDMLIENAITAAPAGTEVLVQALERDAGCTLSVIDRGPGIAPADSARLLQRHGRISGRAAGSAGVPTGQEGMGLGLPITRELMALHGGRLSIAPAPSNTGTRVSLWFPPDRVHVEGRPGA